MTDEVGSVESGIRATLRAAGAVGHDTLAVDWEAHPLGPPEEWPRSLQTIVGVVLTSRFAMWMAWGPELTFFCNDAYRRDTLGKKYPWALGRSAREVWAEIWPDIGPRIETVMRTGIATWDEALLLFLERSGYVEETYHTFSYSPLADDDGRIAGMLCVVSEDTERVVGERRMATLRDLGTGASMLTVEEVLAAVSQPLADNAHDVPFSLIHLFGEENGEAWLGRATGISPEHPAAAASAWPVASAAAGSTELVELAFEALPTGAWDEPPVAALVLPLPQQGQGPPSGFLVAGLNRYRPLDDDYRAFLGLVAGQIAGGIASARAYGAERRRAEALAELDRAKTAFFTNVSHELRTPLTLLLGPAEDALIDTDTPLADPQRQRVDVINRNAQRLLKLVNTLLDFSRLESGQAQAHYEAVDLARYTAELASMFESAVQRAGLTLEISCPPLPEPVFVDREMWAKIVLNLVSNALKFTFEGGIAVAVSAVDGEARLTVADTGIGIPDEEQPRLFERFHRVAGVRSRSHEGSGIGLALVAELAALHGGGATVSSARGEGSTFTVTVPFGAAHLPAEDVRGASESAVTARQQAQSFLVEAMRWLGETGFAETIQVAPDAPRVLVVDDNADMRDYIATLLAGDYAVETAADGAIALERARAHPPDLVLTDVMMPNLDGFGLLAALQADPVTTSVPVIMLSARAGEEGTIEGLEAGADDYLIKPFAARELLARVAANLELERVRRTRDQLRRGQDLIDQAQRLARVGSWEIELATGAISGSDELARLVRLSAEELRSEGLENALARRIAADDLERVRAALEGGAAGRPVDLEVCLVGLDDEQPWVRVLGELERDGDGLPVRLRGSLQDITAQRAAEQAITAAAAEREAAGRERAIADELQHSLLPPMDFDPDQLEVATFYQPGVADTQVGGDWYDVIEVGAGRTALVIGDVMGRGVRAAAVMGQLRAAVRAYARLDLPPADVLEYLDGVVRELGEVQIVTCIYAIFDPRDRTLMYANAGHLPPLLAVPGAGVRRLTGAAGPPLGAGPLTLEEEQVALPVGSLLALYTDGLVERRTRNLDIGIDELAALLGHVEGSIADIPGVLVHALAPEGSDDDVAVLVATVSDQTPPPSANLSIDDDVRAVHQARSFTRGTLDEWSLPVSLARDAILLVSEMVTNAIVHGRAPIHLHLRHAREHLVVEVEDTATAVPRKLRPTTNDVHGRGLQLVAMMADEWGTRPIHDGKSVWCALELTRYG
ncbi:SpoIIE family protein phosphatase [Solirubrobacter ginsenosidimutans]|uniref:histidine kinase n=1 Tax=Solirubrobacter ginsenosidimutans TaxID=490573 RepID=A0A9X3N141_9ACTN|nr:SpoIIE family protein phosphatase [Solirubrobacter ginsenosidimutans]MDA0166534.1 SpoIIE family protein phosphatase [Solirubrobacter ginsenosidimutans]